ncbi:cAMP-dependent protein kinase inhibitor beta isoform X1 [Denticeps clupeoides]|uniref:cAMP-dependent protein kinase inhibitor beta isoform X1 n=1 Tax=Denticeps clupeoides TaxID=299321 RepID=UPI0010A33F97|nr:cAMP-dependent protein kinase inhibitor beta isoform X1 [Denticeps clupeoides]
MTDVEPVVTDFASTGRTGRRNAMPDILGSTAGPGASELQQKLSDLKLGEVCGVHSALWRPVHAGAGGVAAWIDVAQISLTLFPVWIKGADRSSSIFKRALLHETSVPRQLELPGDSIKRGEQRCIQQRSRADY